MRKYTTLIVLLLLAGLLSAQETETRLSDKLFLGGSFGLQFGTETQIALYPQVGYKITPKLIVGLGATYKYYNNSAYEYSTSIYGGSAFSRFIVLPEFFLHAELEYMSFEPWGAERRWVTPVLLGGGYRQPFGERAAATLSILWDVNESAFSPYQNPIVRMGFSF